MKQVGHIITLETLVQFLMHSFRRHGQAFFADALANLNGRNTKNEDLKSSKAPTIEGKQGPRPEQWNDLLSNGAVRNEPFIGENTEQLLKELAPTYERLENVAERSVHAGCHPP